LTFVFTAEVHRGISRRGSRRLGEEELQVLNH